MQTMKHKRDLKPNGTPLTAPFIMPCYLILKGYFSLIILWSSELLPQEKICCRLSVPPLHREVKGQWFSALLTGTSAGEMLYCSWAWSWTFHMKDSFPRPPFCLFFLFHSNLFDLKRVFLINIYHACFSTLYSLELDSTHSLRETGPSSIQTPKSFTVMRMKTKPIRWSLSFFFSASFSSFKFSVSVLICPRPLFNCVLHAALKWTRSCQNSLEWVSLINITAKPPSRVQKINGLQFFPEGTTVFFSPFFGGWVGYYMSQAVA